MPRSYHRRPTAMPKGDKLMPRSYPPRPTTMPKSLWDALKDSTPKPLSPSEADELHETAKSTDYYLSDANKWRTPQQVLDARLNQLRIDERSGDGGLVPIRFIGLVMGVRAFRLGLLIMEGENTRDSSGFHFTEPEMERLGSIAEDVVGTVSIDDIARPYNLIQRELRYNPLTARNTSQELTSLIGHGIGLRAVQLSVPSARV